MMVASIRSSEVKTEQFGSWPLHRMVRSSRKVPQFLEPLVVVFFFKDSTRQLHFPMVGSLVVPFPENP